MFSSSPPAVKVQGVVVEPVLIKQENNNKRTICIDEKTKNHHREDTGTAAATATTTSDNVDAEGDGDIQLVSDSSNKKPRLYSSYLPEETAATTATIKATEEEVQLVATTGPTALVDFAHPRQDCVVHPMEQDSTKFCPNCFCYVCDVAAADCLEWLTTTKTGCGLLSHHQATRNSPYWDLERTKCKQKQQQQQKMKDLTATAATTTEAITVPENLFDFDEEYKKLPQDWSNRGHFLFENAYKDLQKRAKGNGYFYEDEETFLAAMELYNRQGCRLRKSKSMSMYFGEGYEYEEWISTRVWVMHEVAGSHRKPCKHCNHEFLRYVDKYYFIDNWDGPFSADKLCLGCMGCKLCLSVGVNKEQILAELQVLRDKQKSMFCSGISNYQYWKSPFKDEAKKWYLL